MTPKSTGQIRRSQVITTYGPGALIDLPRDSAVVAGIDGWGSSLERLDEPRVQQALARMTGVQSPELRVPPTPDPAEFWSASPRGIDAFRFPEWFVVQEAPSWAKPASSDRPRSRRLVHRRALEKGRFDGRPVVATRFVMACRKGHVADLPWRAFAHRGSSGCLGQLWLDETGATGELANLRVRCECGSSRAMTDANALDGNALGSCAGARPWLGPNAGEDCDEPGRLLIRTATNAYFPLLVRALSIPEKGAAVDQAVGEVWTFLMAVENPTDLASFKKLPGVADALAGFDDEDVLAAIRRRNGAATEERSVKDVEIEVMLAVPEGFGDDVPVNPDFHARKLRRRDRSRRFGESIETVVQVHRLREVLALAGFTRLEGPMPDIDGEYRDDVERADISIDPRWFPAVENRGEGSADPLLRRRDRRVAGAAGSLAADQGS